MAKLKISYVNMVTAYAGVTLSAGSWQASAPVSNLANRILATKARSTDATTASTQFRVNLGASRVIQLMGLFGHNCTTAATFRLTAGNSAGGSDLYDSGWLDVWPAVYLPEDLEWEDDNWWTGVLSEEDREGYPIQLLHLLGQAVRAQHWTVEINDTTNGDGYVEAGYLWLGAVWSPERNYRYGAGLAWEHRSQIEQSLGGVIYVDERSPARVWDFQLEALTDVEAFGTVLELQRKAGNSGYVVVIPDSDDAVRRHHRDILGRMRRFDPIKQAFYGHQTFGGEIEEIVG